MDENIQCICPHCETVVEVSAKYIGQIAQCGECGEPFEVRPRAETGEGDSGVSARPPPAPGDELLDCPECGSHIQPGVGKCRHCGATICPACSESVAARARKCRHCGAKINVQGKRLNASRRGARRGSRSQGLRQLPGATESLVFGVLSLACCWIIFAPLALMKASEALSYRARNPEASGEGMAVAGRVLGIIGIVLGCLAIFFRLILLLLN